jgi:DNA-binding response OmpR family regulator
MPSPTLPRVLVLDDDLHIHEAVRAALAGHYDVHTAATGAEACRLLPQHEFAAIILDARLREEDGLALVGRLRALSDARILLCSGYGSEELADRGIWAGVNGYLKKPLGVPELQAALRRLLATSEPLSTLAARARRALDELPVNKSLRLAEVAGSLGVFGTVTIHFTTF